MASNAPRISIAIVLAEMLIDNRSESLDDIIAGRVIKTSLNSFSLRLFLYILVTLDRDIASITPNFPVNPIILSSCASDLCVVLRFVVVVIS